jgi:serine/threonine-protein kinase HipA
MYPGRRTPVLAPSFDTLTTGLANGRDRLALPLAGEKDMSRVTLATFTDFAGVAGLAPKAVQRCVRNTVRRALADWPGLIAQLPLDEPTREYVLARLARLPLATGGESRLAAA